MSDAAWRELERRYSAGELDVLPQLLRTRFTIDPNLENAEALFDYERGHELPIDLADPHIQIFIDGSEHAYRLCWIDRNRIFVGGLSLLTPGFSIPASDVEKCRERSIEVVRAQLPDDDLQLVKREHLHKIESIITAAETAYNKGIFSNLIPSFIDKLRTFIGPLALRLEKIEADRNHLRKEFDDYLQLLANGFSPLEAGKAWYQQQCAKYTDHWNITVLTPEQKVLYYDAPSSGESGVYAPSCYFPFYEFLTDEFISDMPQTNFLAAISEEANSEWHDDWEADLREEELEQFLEERAEEYDMSLEEFRENAYDYDDDRDFERYFTETVLPKAKAALIQEAIDETIDTIIEEYLETSPELSIAEMWEQMSHGSVEHIDIHYDIEEELDREWRSEVSMVVDEPFERWRKPKLKSGQTGEPAPEVSVTPLEEYQSRNHYSRISERTRWWDLNTKQWCRKPPMIKVDTRAIGWKAAFGIEPLVI